MLEEDLRTGGSGIPVGEEEHGAGLDGLEGRRSKGPGPHVSPAGSDIMLRLNPLGLTASDLFKIVYGIPEWLSKGSRLRT